MVNGKFLGLFLYEFEYIGRFSSIRWCTFKCYKQEKIFCDFSYLKSYVFVINGRTILFSKHGKIKRWKREIGHTTLSLTLTYMLENDVYY